MNNKFEDNVKKLFLDIVTENNGNSHAEELLNTLLCKLTLPLNYWWENNILRIVYYNVSINVDSSLSSMEISYTGDTTMTITGLQQCDTFQLAEFILALEKDIPQWRHIWATEDNLETEKRKIAERIKTNLRDIRHCLITSKTKLPDEIEEKYRIRFYNVQASKLMLSHDIPFWTNKKNETEILKECNIFHIDAPIEQWLDAWIQFKEDCNSQKAERERKRDEQQDKLMKMRHLIKLKQLKFETFIKTIELHPSVSVKVNALFDYRKITATRYGWYRINIGIDGAYTKYVIKFDHFDACTNKIIEYIKRINDIVPELRQALLDDGITYYITDRNHIFETNEMPFYVATYSNEKQREIPCTNLTSSRVVNRINRICEELRLYIHNYEYESIAAIS